MDVPGLHWHWELCRVNNGPWFPCLSDLTISPWFLVGLAALLIAGLTGLLMILTWFLGRR